MIDEKMEKLLDGLANGYTSEELFVEKRNFYAYTYDDIIIMPGHVNFDADEVALETNISRNIKLKLPLLSSPMDTVTEHSMAIGMALLGAIGIIHYNMSVEDQANEVRLVKRYKNGFITDPACLSPDHVIADVDRLKAQFGYSGIPITIDGNFGSKLLGIVTIRDIDYVEDRSTKLREIMTTDLVTGIIRTHLLFVLFFALFIFQFFFNFFFVYLSTAPEGVSLAEANEVLQRSKKGKLPVVNAAGDIVALISRTGK